MSSSTSAKLKWITLAASMFMIVIVLIASQLLTILVPIGIPKFTGGITLMKICLWFAVVQAASLPLNTLFATGKSWRYGKGVLIGFGIFLTSAYFLSSILDGVLAVALGSLLGQASRTLSGYWEIHTIMAGEGT